MDSLIFYCTMQIQQKQLFVDQDLIMQQQKPQLLQQNQHTHYPISYQSDIIRIMEYQQFYKILLTKYELCIGCTYRTLSLMTPKMYSDIKVFKMIGQQILSQSKQPCQKQINDVFRKIIDNAEQYFYNPQKICWLCSGILQTPFLHKMTKQIMTKIVDELYDKKQKYKLNVKVDTILTIKFIVFMNLLAIEMNEFVQSNIFQSKQYQYKVINQIIKPHLQKNGSLQLKTVFKWMISNVINQQEISTQFKLTSTINEDQNTVIAGLEIDYKGQKLEKMLENIFGSLMHLNAIQSKPNKNKKVKIDISDPHYAIKWNANLVLKIITIDRKQWEQCAQKNTIQALRNAEQSETLMEQNMMGQEIPQRQSMLDQQQQAFLQEKLNNKFKKKKPQKQTNSHNKIQTKLQLQSQHIYLCGRYVKFSRYLSQTPWIINKQRLTESSLQEEVQRQIIRFFFPHQIKFEDIEIKFHAGGREDIDVRMLKGGRPFVLELVNPRRSFSQLTISSIMQAIREKVSPKIVQNLGDIESLSNQDNISDEQQLKIKQNLLQFLINNTTDLAKVYEFKKTTATFISNELKQAESEKIKHYVCYIKSQKQEFGKEDKEILQKQYNLKIIQKTPLRVLHRRTLMYRQKMVHKMIYHPVSRYSAVLEIWASAGTYIKEFVHGDMNRTLPNVGSLLGKGVDILQLDVGSLKEGEWVQGADQEMKLGELPWQKNLKK